jgi:hypothetical protein
MQPFHEIEKSYETPDPWGVQKNPEDKKRKRYILHMLDLFGPYERVLDIACGEAWITKDIEANDLWGYELSNNAAQRFPDSVRRAVFPDGKYDLVIACGCLYKHYNWPFFLKIIEEHASRYVLTCNIKDWEVKEIEKISGFRLLEMEFPYKPGDTKFTQKLRMFEK